MEGKTVMGELCPIYVPAPVARGLSFLLGMSPHKEKGDKKMKKILSLILAVVMLFCLVSCFTTTVAEQGDVTLVIENRDGSYTVYEAFLEDVSNKGEGVYGVLQYLMARETDPLVADVVDSTYGAYVNNIGGLNPDATKNEYVCIYTSLERDFDTSDYVSVIEYEGTTLKTSGLGLTSMSAEQGTIILFRIETY